MWFESFGRNHPENKNPQARVFIKHPIPDWCPLVEPPKTK